MKNLKIVLEIRSPIVMPRFPIHLDALVYFGLGCNMDRLSESIAKDDRGIYRASAMRFLRHLGDMITETTVAHCTRTIWEDFKIPMVPKVGNIITKGGPYRKKMTKRNAITTKYVVFYAVGDAEKIKYALSTLSFVGVSNQQGFGEIGNIEIEEIENDFSFFDEDAELARVLPSDMVPSEDEYMKQDMRFKPPYMETEITECAVPNFKLITVN